MTKKIILINSTIEEDIRRNFKNKDVEILSIKNFDGNEAADIVIVESKNDLPEKQENFKNIIMVHPSLLPAFYEENALQKAYVSGVKVTGLSILNVKNESIITQYPVLIGLTTTLNELQSEILNLKSFLVPLVVESILKDEVFDFSDLFRTSCHHSGGCAGCSSCKKRN